MQKRLLPFGCVTARVNELKKNKSNRRAPPPPPSDQFFPHLLFAHFKVLSVGAKASGSSQRTPVDNIMNNNYPPTSNCFLHRFSSMQLLLLLLPLMPNGLFEFIHTIRDVQHLDAR